MREAIATHSVPPLRRAIKKVLKWVIILFGVFAVLSIVAIVKEGSRLQKSWEGLSWFQIDDVAVEAEWPLDAGKIRETLKAIKGQSLIQLDGKGLVDWLERMPWVEAVVLKKEYPRGLRLKIASKKPRMIAVVKGVSYFLDARGGVIDRVSPERIRDPSLPILSVDKKAHLEGWPLSEIVDFPTRFQKFTATQFRVSQMALENFPYFRIYLVSPRVEVIFNFENWESQIPQLTLLLQNPPRRAGLLRSINLTLPKKAIVSSTNSN